MNKPGEEMHENNIELMRQEASRLVEWEIELLEELDAKELLSESKEGEKQTFDKNKIKRAVEVLNGEKYKLQNLQMTLAVVGTMKAGKSTTINAIVGAEVLPNRNRPMTSLPTLIKHQPGATIPILKFVNQGPAQSFCDLLAEKVQKDGSSQLKDKTLLSTLEEVCNGWKIQNEYKGAEEIFEFLRHLNDLVRLAEVMDIPFPFAEYDEVHELPIIEIQFETLRDSNGLGELLLLDTPGPNEAGMQELSSMMEDQLQKASAVLAVMDFTQLRSEADDVVRQNLKDISEYTKGRLFALVNKYDQKDRNSMELESVKEYVAESLMNGEIESRNVFPVSSKYGYLANCALNAVNEHNELSAASAKENPWLEDFAELAFGAAWDEEDLEDVSSVENAATRLWKKSCFQKPLTEVIHKSHANASIVALESVVSKLIRNINDLENFLAVRGTSLEKDAEEIQKMIAGIQDDIKHVDIIKSIAEEAKGKAVSDISQRCKQLFEEADSATRDVVKHYFEKGKIQEKKRVERKGEEKKKEEKGNQFGFGAEILRAILGTDMSTRNRGQKSGVDFNPKEPKIRFEESDKSEAQELVATVSKALEEVFSGSIKKANFELDKLIKQFDQKMVEEVTKPSIMLLNELQDRMKGEGVELCLTLPDIDPLKLPFNGRQLIAKIESKSETRTRLVDRKSLGGAAKRFFGNIFGQDDWGRDEEEYKKKYFIVDMKKLEENVLNEISSAFKNLEKGIKRTVEKPIASSLEAFFEELSSTIEMVRGDLSQGLKDSKTKSKEKKKLLNNIRQIQKSTPDCREDAERLREQLL